MKRLLFLFLVTLHWPLTTHALEPAGDPALASVRIKSHGASGTVIASRPGKSWVLGCAHMLTDILGNPSEEARKLPLAIDGPVQPYAVFGPTEAQKSTARLVAWDYDLDLSLIEIDNGPFHFVPVAPKRHKPSKRIFSCGYDDMSWPITRKPVTILSTDETTTFTREKPWHGRSGGGLIDVEARVLIGVVQGYEIRPDGRGIYVSHEAIVKFLAAHKLTPASSEDDLPLQRQDYSDRGGRELRDEEDIRR